MNEWIKAQQWEPHEKPAVMQYRLKLETLDQSIARYGCNDGVSGESQTVVFEIPRSKWEALGCQGFIDVDIKVLPA